MRRSGSSRCPESQCRRSNRFPQVLSVQSTGSHRYCQFTGTVSSEYRFIGFQGDWATDYRHKVFMFNGSTNKYFGDRFWFSGHRFTCYNYRSQGSPVVGS